MDVNKFGKIRAISILFFNIADTCSVSPEDRNDCGWYGIDKETCEDRGCCYDDTDFGFETKWCFYPTGLYTVQRKIDHLAWLKPGLDQLSVEYLWISWCDIPLCNVTPDQLTVLHNDLAFYCCTFCIACKVSLPPFCFRHFFHHFSWHKANNKDTP